MRENGFHECYGNPTDRTGCYKNGVECRFMRGAHWTLYNERDRWRLAGYPTPPADAPLPTAAELKRDAPFTVRMAKAAAAEVNLEAFSSTDENMLQGAHLGMLGRLVNMAVSREADDNRDVLASEREAAGDERQGAVDPLHPGDEESSDSEGEGFLDAEALAAIDTHGLLADSKDAAEAEQLYKRHGLVGGPVADRGGAPTSTAHVTAAANEVADVQRLAGTLAAANKTAVNKLRGLVDPADAPEASPFVGDGEAEEPDLTIPEPADVRAAMDTSDDGDLTKWDIGRTRGGLTLEETCRTGAKDHAAGTEYGAPLNERQAVAVRLILSNFEARRPDSSGARPPPRRVLVVGSPGTGKSVVMNAVRRHYHSWNHLYEVRCGAPTGSAAFKIYGRTTTQLRGGGRKARLTARPHAGVPSVGRLSTRVGDHKQAFAALGARRRTTVNPRPPLTRVEAHSTKHPRSKAKLEDEYRVATLLMVDEVSMMSLEFVDRWDEHLNQAKNKPAGAFFGDMDVAWFGDPAQFPSLGGHSLFAFSQIFDDESLSMAARVKAIERKVKATKKKSRTEIAMEIVRAIKKYRSA